MCGITGFWELKKTFPAASLEQIVQTMADQLESRGPDSSGIWVDAPQGLALGHRRLAIQDLSETGHQPMFSPSKRFVITYNGEVYNGSELRQELEPQGFRFRGTSDTEVMLAAFEAWGIEKAVQRFIGMFAFAVWDAETQTVTLVRDRLGIKPLYWGFQENIFFFGSQLKSFRPHPAWKPEVNSDALSPYLRLGYIPSPLSIYKGFHKLKPGMLLTLNKAGNTFEKPYWQIEDVIQKGRQSPKRTAKPEDLVEELDLLLRDAVKKRMIADVPLGAFLSGGIDSSTVVALMQAQSDRPVKTFSIGFYEDAYNEAQHAKKVAAHLKTEHHELYLHAREAMDIIPTLPDWYDEPFADSSQIPTYLVSRLAREHVIVSLSGDGGDELFAGYTRYLFLSQMWKYIGRLPVSARKLFIKMIGVLTPNQWTQFADKTGLGQKFNLFGDKLYKASDLLSFKEPADLYKKIVSLWEEPAKLLMEGRDTLNWPTPLPGLNITEQAQYLDLLTYLPEDILTKVDRASMALGLEARVPLLDHRVVEWAWQVPLEMKIRGGQAKWLLRQVLYKYVPKDLIERPKMGFGVPIDHWLRQDLRGWAESYLTREKLEASGLNPKPILEKWQEHLSGQRNWQYALWNILMYQSWRYRES